MRSPIFTIPSGSTDSFQDQENDTYEADDGHEEDLLDFAVSRSNGSILDETLTHVAQRPRPSSSSAASTLKPHSAAAMAHRLSTNGEPSMTEEAEEDFRPEEEGSPLTVVDAAAVEEARLKANVRRYYALMELFETEKGYLNDLRVLVEVCPSFSALIIISSHFPVYFSCSPPSFCPTNICTSVSTSSPHVLERVRMTRAGQSFPVLRTSFNHPLAKLSEDPASAILGRAERYACSGWPLYARMHCFFAGDRTVSPAEIGCWPPALHTFNFDFVIWYIYCDGLRGSALPRFSPDRPVRSVILSAHSTLCC